MGLGRALSVRTRLTLWYGGVLLAIVLVISAVSYVFVRLGPVEPLVVRGDQLTLRRAIVNLVENAIKFTGAGGTVELSLERDGRYAVLAVRDTGVGMNPEDAERIFEPFVRLDGARTTDNGGAGLGLSIVHSIVVAHDGRLSVQTAPGIGSTFTMRLPLA